MSPRISVTSFMVFLTSFMVFVTSFMVCVTFSSSLVTLVFILFTECVDKREEEVSSEPPHNSPSPPNELTLCLLTAIVTCKQSAPGQMRRGYTHTCICSDISHG